MGKYGAVALRAVTLLSQGETPPSAWRTAARAEFPGKVASQEKLAREVSSSASARTVFVTGVPRGTYTRSVANKANGLKAVEIVGRHPGVASRGAGELWVLVMDGQPPTPNYQMDVVLALWNAQLIEADC